MIGIFIQLIIFALCLLATAFFAFVETTFTALRLYKVRALEAQSPGYDYFFDLWRKNPQRILIGILLSGNFFGILGSVVISRMMETSFGEIGLLIGVSASTIISLILGDIVPKTLAKTKAAALFSSIIGTMNFITKMLHYIVSILFSISNMILRLLNVDPAVNDNEDVSEKEIEFLIGHGEETGKINTEKSNMLKGIFSIGSTTIKNIMVPKADLFMIEANTPIQIAIDAIGEVKFSRAPIFEGNENNVIGCILLKDLIDALKKEEIKTVKEIIRPILVVPGNKKVNLILKDFLANKAHLAIIADEHGGVEGLVTLENVMEEIIGDIYDEFEQTKIKINPLQEGGYQINASIDIKTVAELLSLPIENTESTTLAGFIMEKLEKVPKKGDIFSHEDYVFTIEKATPTQVLTVNVNKKIR